MLTLRGQSAGSGGTLQRPLELPLDLSRVSPAPIVRRLELGYSQGSSTAVYGFTASRRVALSLVRRSEDQLVVHVDVALLEATSRRRLAPLTANASGVSESLVLPAGRYLIVASLLVPETVALELEIAITPVLTPLRGQAAFAGAGLARRSAPLLQGSASGGGALCGASLVDPLLQGQMAAALEARLSASAIAAISGRLQGSGGSEGSGLAALRPFQWIDNRGRVAGALVTARAAVWDRALLDGTSDLLLLRLVDQQGSPLDLSGLEVALELWDRHRFWRFGLYDVVIADAASGLIRLEWDGSVAARPGQDYFSSSGNVLLGEANEWLVTEGDLQLALEYDGIHTLSEEISWDLRVRSVVTGQTVYLLEGMFTSLPRYSAIEAVLLSEGDDWLLSEGEQFLALEAA